MLREEAILLIKKLQSLAQQDESTHEADTAQLRIAELMTKYSITEKDLIEVTQDQADTAIDQFSLHGLLHLLNDMPKDFAADIVRLIAGWKKTDERADIITDGLFTMMKYALHSSTKETKHD